MKITGTNSYRPVYPLEEQGAGRLADVGDEEYIVFFKPTEVEYRYIIDDETTVLFVHEEDIVGYLE